MAHALSQDHFAKRTSMIWAVHRASPASSRPRTLISRRFG
jgi:hypothetical protein